MQKASSTRAKSEFAWLDGVYLGALWMSNEYVIGTDKGVT